MQAKTSSIDSIKINNISTNDNQLIADEFNSFFATVGVNISNSILPTSLEPDDFIPPNPNPPNLELGITSPATVFNTIANLTPKNSVDIDGLSIKLITHIAITICTPLSNIFNLSITTGTFPSKLKRSRTVPIFKSGDPESCDNYRPISLLSSISKILEKLISVQLVNQLELNNLLYKHQYGFQRKKSTEHNLLQISNYIFNALNNKEKCLGIFLDLKKTFDVCSHEILLKK